VHPVGPGGHEQVTAFHKEADRLIADTQLTDIQLTCGCQKLDRRP
jgi:hypothetical protein